MASRDQEQQTQRSMCSQSEANFEWLEYDVSLATNAHATATPNNNNSSSSSRKVYVYVHEKRKDTRVTIAELLSHKVNAGVDNTGNVRTWPSEPLLLAHVLRTQVCERLYEQRCSAVKRSAAALNVCELGSGMAGLASLGLLAHAPVPLSRVEITDGNPLAVQNLQRCVDENTALGVFAHARVASIAARLLRWDRHATFAAPERQQVDLLLASDCLFFEDFHVDLAHTIRELLRPGSGQCLLLQPRRGGSMERFVRVAQDVGLCVGRCAAFDRAVAEQHAAYERERADYVPDVHLPVLLTVIAPLTLEREH